MSFVATVCAASLLGCAASDDALDDEQFVAETEMALGEDAWYTRVCNLANSCHQVPGYTCEWSVRGKSTTNTYGNSSCLHADNFRTDLAVDADVSDPVFVWVRLHDDEVLTKAECENLYIYAKIWKYVGGKWVPAKYTAAGKEAVVRYKGSWNASASTCSTVPRSDNTMGDTIVLSGASKIQFSARTLTLDSKKKVHVLLDKAGSCM